MAESYRPTVLFIDDDRDILTLMDYVFSEESMELITRRTPEEGLLVLAERSIDCVFLDIHFARAPEGFGFMAAMGGLAAERRIPCLVTSAMDSREVENRVMALGARKFIPKPFFPAEVVDAIRTAVAAHV
ncbi:MAG: response regulator [Deferrisomatales bacterium]|nr:response regulator [Deferrisomatales bacterium]